MTGQKTSKSAGLPAAANKGWSLVRYWGTSGTTAPPALAGQDLHLKYVPLVGLHIFFLMKSSVSLHLSRQNCLCANYSSPSVKNINKFQIAQIISSKERENLYFVCKYSDIANKHTT